VVTGVLLGFGVFDLLLGVWLLHWVSSFWDSNTQPSRMFPDGIGNRANGDVVGWHHRDAAHVT
jgi:hypothetical protein